MKTNYKHISKRERKQIQELMQAGKTNKEIAEELGRAVKHLRYRFVTLSFLH